VIAGEVLKNRVQPSDLDIDRYLKLLLSEKKLSQEPFQAVTKIEEKQLAGNTLDAVCVNSVKVGDGVNALKGGTQIDFAPGATVIFGENGSGKSGFVRVLKRAAGVRTELLRTFFTPGELSLFPLVQNAIERVRAALEATITVRTPGTNAILVSFDRSCSIYPIIETLGAATDLDEIRKYAVLPDNIDATIESLKIEVDALKSSNIQNQLKRSRDRAAIVKALKAAIETAKAFDISPPLAR
jgi:hypothetical protein